MQSIKPATKPAFPRELGVLALLVVIVWGLWAGREFFVPMSLAILLAFLAAPLVKWLRGRRVPEWLALGLAAFLFLLPVGLVGYMMLRQAQSLITDYPTIMASLQTWIQHVSSSGIGQKLHLGDHLTLAALLEQLGSGAGAEMQVVGASLKTIFEAGTESVLIFLFAMIMLATRDHLYAAGEKILASFEDVEAPKLLESVTDLIEQFLLTKLIVIGIISVLSFVALQLLGLKYAFLLGMMVGVLTLLPEVGFVMSLVPITLVAIATGTSALSILGILGAMTAIHLVEANLLTPKLVGKQLNLNVLATFVGLFAGSLLWGVWGMLLCVPILGIMRIVFSSTDSLHPWAFLLSERTDE